jgi:CRP/FNR family transcriptional regulator
MSAEIKHDHDLMMLLNKRSAEERLLYFLNDLSQRFEERGFSAKQFNLSMTRNEIGNYLGLTLETISRLLTRFQKEELIKVDGKLISIVDFNGIKQRFPDMEVNFTSAY